MKTYRIIDVAVLAHHRVKIKESVGNGHATRVQILDENNCISHGTNTLGKGMNPIILPLTMGK